MNEPIRHLRLTVKADGGSDVKDVAYELVLLAQRFGIAVHCEINDITLIARPDDRWQLLVAAYWECMGGTGKIACARPEGTP